MKGQSLLIWHAIAISISIVVVMFTVISLANIQRDFQDFVGREEVRQACSIVKSAAIKAYRPSAYVSPDNSTLASIWIDMPLKIAGFNYRATFINRSVGVRLIGSQLNYTCMIGINATFAGSSAGGPSVVRWTRLGNSTDLIELVQVES